MTAATADGALFDAVLRPHRSLSPLGFRLLMAGFAAALLALGGFFASLGAWPVLPFCGLELFLLWGAFKLNFRAGRRYEALRLLPDRLEIARVRASGESERHAFAPPHWLAVEIEERPDGGNRLLLRSHGRTLAIGDFLAPDERIELAQALRGALNRLRRAEA